jgi:hypothetical protein
VRALTVGGDPASCGLAVVGDPASPRPRRYGQRAVPTGGARAARALAAVGTLCVLAGLNLFAAVPAPAVVEIGGPTGSVRPHAPALVGPLAMAGGARLLSLAEPARSTPSTPSPAGTPPVELTLPARGVRAPVVAVTTGPEGALLVPEPPSTVGWWSPSALAGGAGGTTVLAGHVDSRDAGLGALAVLRHVGPGEELVLGGADGRDIAYRVTARRQYAKAELPPEVFAAGGPARLVLITCGGAFDRATRHYADNVVVFADPV